MALRRLRHDDARRPQQPAVQDIAALHDGQRAVLVLGATEHLPLEAGATPTSLTFLIPEAQVGVHLARLRTDGIDSPVIDMDFEPPQVPRFLDRTVEFT